MRARGPIEVRVVWHPHDVPAPDEHRPVTLPDQLFAILQGDPTLPAGEHLHVPVYFHTAATGELPVDVPIDRADHVIVVALAGDALMEDDRWFRWLAALRERIDHQPSVDLVGICLSRSANDSSALWGSRSRERTFQIDDAVERDRAVRIVVLRTIARRLLGDRKLTVFISHAKADGADHAAGLADAVRALRADTFLDVEEIEGGQDFEKVLDAAINADSVMVAVVSDHYARRPWCRWEALLAKQRGVATVVFDMVSESQQRSVPHLGNTPVVRCNAPTDPVARAKHAASPAARVAYARAIEAGAGELVRTLVFPLQVRAMVERFGGDAATWLAFPTPPELLHVVSHLDELRTGRGGVYPDPPVPAFERELLAAASSPATLTTRMALAAQLAAGGSGTGNPRPLLVGIAISASDEASLHRRALGSVHLDALFMQLCTQLLSAQHSLAYGGDPLLTFTVALRDLDRAYGFGARGGPKRLRNYLARYVVEAAAFKRADFRDAMDLVNVDRAVADDEPDVLRPVLDLTAMRRRMTQDIDVRIAVGGDPTPGRPGTRRGPGVLEEAYLALAEGRPLLVGGGFGGASALIADALLGRLDPAAVDAIAAHFAGTGMLLAATAEPHTFPEMLAAFTPATDLRNALTPDENVALLTTDDIDTAVGLLLLSVQRLAHPR